MIKKIEIDAFKGITNKVIDVTDKITVISGPNGSGKTTVLEALSYALFGSAAKEEILGKSNGRKVTVTIGDDVITREYNGKLNKCQLNGKDIQATVLDGYILKTYFGGCDPDMAKLMFSPVKSLDSQSFMRFLSAYLNEKITVEKLKSFITGASAEYIPDIEMMAEISLPDSFTLEDLSKFAAMVDDMRKSAKAEAKTLQAAVQTIEKAKDAPVVPKMDPDEQNALEAEKDSLLKKKADLEDAARTELSRYNENYHAITKFKSAYDNATALIEKLSGSACPLCDKITCTTDKTPIKLELEKQKKDAYDVMATLKGNCEDAKKKADEANASLSSINGRISEIDRKFYENSLVGESKNIAGLEELKVKLDAATKDADRKKAIYDLLRDEGPVRQNILDYYLQAFNTFLNESAESYKSGYEYSLVKEKGIAVYVKSEHTDKFVALDSLSNGEKVVAMYFIITLLADLSGEGYMTIDSAEALDKPSAEALAKCLKASNLENAFVTCCNEDVAKCFS